MRSISRLTNITSVLAAAAIIAAPANADAQGAGSWGGSGKKAEGHYADVNGIKLYYEIHGKGRPLVLLHGGLGAIEMFGPNLTALAANHQVIAVDLQGHGRTADIDRPLSVESLADASRARIRSVQLERPEGRGRSLA